MDYILIKWWIYQNINLLFQHLYPAVWLAQLLTFNHIVLGLILGVSMWDGYGHQVGQLGFSKVFDTYLHFLHTFSPKAEHRGSVLVQAVCTVLVTMPEQCVCTYIYSHHDICFTYKSRPIQTDHFPVVCPSVTLCVFLFWLSKYY